MHLDSLLSPQLILLAVAVAVLIRFVLRPVVEHFLPGAVVNPLYTKVILPGSAVALGGLLGLAMSALPESIIGGNVVDKLIFGVCAGGLSTLVFRAARALLKKVSSEPAE